MVFALQLCKKSHVSVLTQVRREVGLPDDQYSFTALMGAAGREGDAATVEETFNLASAAGISSTFMCNTAMSSLAKTGSAEVCPCCLQGCSRKGCTWNDPIELSFKSISQF